MKRCNMSERTKMRYKNTTYELQYLKDIVEAILHLESHGLLTYEIEDALLSSYKEILESIIEDYKVFCIS